MKKQKTVYVCSQCGYESLKWVGKCPSCDQWNTFVEEVKESTRGTAKSEKGSSKPLKLSEIETTEDYRIHTGIVEFDRVLGGGFIPGSVVLLGGEPGIGKSTLILQAASKIQNDVLYVTGEESAQQIKLRAKRLQIDNECLRVLAETNLSEILHAINEYKPKVVIFDSIQTIYDNRLENSPGTVTQIRECTSTIMEDAKRKLYVAVVIGHVTKEGVIAGPKILEHIVDTVLQFEGDTSHSYRIIRALKNRFGNTHELGIFEMHDNGLNEVKNPSKLFISENNRHISGTCITGSIEGTRPLLIEVQALVTPTAFGNPQRVSTGFDNRRLSILLAVLERRAGQRVSTQDVFLNIAGGVRIAEPATDLAICCAVVSGLLDRVVKNETVIIGEVGLGGEVRSVGHIDKRLKEAEKLGFERAVIPAGNKKDLKKNSLEILPADSVVTAINLLL